MNMSLPAYHILLRHSILANTDIEQEILLPNSIFDQLPSDSAAASAKRFTQLSGPKIENDWRHGPIKIEWVDFSSGMGTDSNLGVDKGSKRTGGSVPTNPIASFTSSGLNSQTIKSGATSLPDGVVHIFREFPPARDTLIGQDDLQSLQEVDDGSTSTGVVLGVLSVPAHMTPGDFLNFVTPAAENIMHIRMIRDSAANRSLVLIKFKDVLGASEFAEEYNGREFTSLQSEICNLVHVKSVKIEVHDEISLSNARLSAQSPDAYELPTCPVCLDRMDSSATGLVTIPCMHTFHCTCLTKWGDSRCPVCRYSQLLFSGHRSNTSVGGRRMTLTQPGAPSSASCWDCSSITNLWICVICGNVGCGRYGRAHAQGHYQATTHVYALELETQRVWDYASDGYVHRLIQNKADGKLVELPSASMSSSMGSNATENSKLLGPGPSDNLTAEKIEAIGIEYSYLLTSQLDSQREYFEEQHSKLASKLLAEKDILEQRLEKMRGDEEARTTEIERLRSKAEKRAEKAAELARRFEKELREERAVNEGLLQNISAVKTKLEDAESEKVSYNVKLADMEEQLRDVMFFLETKDKIEKGGEGLEGAAGGSIEVRSPPPPKGSGRTKRK